jgi:hypothetical protein
VDFQLLRQGHQRRVAGGGLLRFQLLLTAVLRSLPLGRQIGEQATLPLTVPRPRLIVPAGNPSPHVFPVRFPLL